jgi:hypothetical protein
MTASSVVSSLTDRQRLICLLVSTGELDKRTAILIGISQRTVELEKQRVAASLRISTPRLVIWAVENRRMLQTDVNWDGVSDAVRNRIAPNCSSEWGCEYCI